MSDHFTLGDACRILGLPWQEVLELVERGILPGERQFHGGWVVDAEATIKYAQERNGR